MTFPTDTSEYAIITLEQFPSLMNVKINHTIALVLVLLGFWMALIASKNGN